MSRIARPITDPAPRYLLVDGHSVLYAWPSLRAIHSNKPFAARQERDALVKAIEADARIIPKCLSGSTLTSNIYNLLYGVTPHGVP